MGKDARLKTFIRELQEVFIGKDGLKMGEEKCYIFPAICYNKCIMRKCTFYPPFRSLYFWVKLLVKPKSITSERFHFKFGRRR